MAKQPVQMTKADYDNIVNATVAGLEKVTADDVTIEHLEKHANKFTGLGQKAAVHRRLRAKRRKREMEAYRTRFETMYGKWVQAGKPLEQVQVKNGVCGLREGK